MTTILATKVFTDPGHTIVIAILGVVAYLLSRSRNALSDKRDVIDPTTSWQYGLGFAGDQQRAR